jgi:hypothetical protein
MSPIDDPRHPRRSCPTRLRASLMPNREEAARVHSSKDDPPMLRLVGEWLAVNQKRLQRAEQPFGTS